VRAQQRGLPSSCGEELKRNISLLLLLAFTVIMSHMSVRLNSHFPLLQCKTAQGVESLLPEAVREAPERGASLSLKGTVSEKVVSKSLGLAVLTVDNDQHSESIALKATE